MLKQMALIVAIIVALPMVWPAAAASFSCAKAYTAHEKHICNDPTLDAADGRMGQSYRSALSVFPVKDFVRATQQRFLLSYPSCDASGGENCKKVIEDRIAYLDSMHDSAVYTDVTTGGAFQPDDGVFWLATSNKVTVLRYFGGYMPDLNQREPFPAGFVCDDAAVLRRAGASWVAIEDQNQIDVSESEVTARISCSPRNGLSGRFPRVATAKTTLRAQVSLDAIAGTWAIGNPAACTTAPYTVTVQANGTPPAIVFTDRAGNANTEDLDTIGPEGFATTTAASRNTTLGTRWTYTLAGPDRFEVRNGENGRRFNLVRCTPGTQPAVMPRTPARTTPTFTDPASLVTWLLQHSGRDFDPGNDTANAAVFSPGLRAALRATFQRSRERNQPPCGANGDIILATQEAGAPENLRTSVQPTAPDRITVAASYDLLGDHRNRRYLTVNLDGAWKLENIIEADGISLRRSLDCR